MIRPIDIKLNAAHPELPLVEATTFTGAPSSVFIRGVPKSVGNWSITAVNVSVTYPDNTTTTRAAVESAEGVWVATIPGTATSGRTPAGFRITADGIDENGAAVTGYVLGFADFSVFSFLPIPAPGETYYLLRYFDTMPTAAKKMDVATIDGILKFYNGTTWLPFGIDDYAALSNKPSINDVTLTGNKTAADLGLATKADATLTERGPNKDGFSAWTVICSNPDIQATVIYNDAFERYELYGENGSLLDYTENQSWPNDTATSLEFSYEDAGLTFTATRTALQGYQLGSQDDKPLASEAEAEELRTAITALAPDWVSGSNYKQYDVVKYNGVYYYARFDINNSTIAPSGDTDWWGSLANLAALAHLLLPLTGGLLTGGLQFQRGVLHPIYISGGGTDAYAGILYRNLLQLSSVTNSGGIESGHYITLTTDGISIFDIGYNLVAKMTFPVLSGTLALLQNLAPNFSTSATYALNALCVYEGVLYRCTTAITTTENWTPAHWTEATVEDVLAALRTAIAGKQDALSQAQLDNIAAVPNKANASDLRYAISESIPLTVTSGAATTTLSDRTHNVRTVAAPGTGNTTTITATLPPIVAGKSRDMFLNLTVGSAASDEGDISLSIVEPSGATVQIDIGSVEDIGVGKNEILISENALPTTSGNVTTTHWLVTVRHEDFAS